MNTLEKTSDHLCALVESLDLCSVRKKLMDLDEGVGWTHEQCIAAEREYRRFLVLLLKYRDRSIVPNEIMDTFWHFHILDTRSYHRDTQLLFGRYLHHDPYFGIGSTEAHAELIAAFEETQSLYEANFGSRMQEEQSSCNAGCRSCRSTTS